MDTQTTNKTLAFSLVKCTAQEGAIIFVRYSDSDQIVEGPVWVDGKSVSVRQGIEIAAADCSFDKLISAGLFQVSESEFLPMLKGCRMLSAGNHL